MKIIIAACSRLVQGTGSRIFSALQNQVSRVERHLQIISIFHYLFSVFLLGVVSIMILLYIFCTDYWLIAALYTAWLVFDWNTPNKGGRRSTWVRNFAVWRYIRDYFPIQLIKTHDLPPSQNYIFGFHPHGIVALGAVCNFGSEATGVSKKFPGIKPHLLTLAGFFRMPFQRDYIISTGICSVSRNSIDYILSKNGTGNAVVIVVGGTAECLDCRPGRNTLTLKQRKGFVKIALQHGAALVPVYSFGESDPYRQVVFKEGSWGQWIQRKFQKYVGFAPSLFYGCGFFSEDTWGLVPYAKPITTVVGKPITVPKIEWPSQEDIDFYHGMYLTSLQKLFDEYKTKFGLSESDVLEII